LISLLVQWGVKRIALGVINMKANQSEAAAEASRAIAGAGANATMSTAAAPWPINLTAPAVGATIQAAAAALYTTGIAQGTALSTAIAGGGLRQYGGTVMGGTPYLVGERGPELFTPNTSGKITPNNELTGGGLTIENMQIHVLENATSADALLAMSDTDMERVVTEKIITAMRAVARHGIKVES